MNIISKPAADEFTVDEPPLVNLVPDDGRLLDHLIYNLEVTTAFILSLPEHKLMYRYAEDKWTIKEVISHLVDMERVYMYRALCFARNDQTLLPGFDAHQFTLFSGAYERDIADLLEELAATRNATILFLRGLSEESLVRAGILNGGRASVRALAYHIAGHELHHINIVKERYL